MARRAVRVAGPSPRHVWRYVGYSELGGSVETCDRCGRSFIEKADGTGPVHCFPRPQWLREHPDDDQQSR